MYICETRSGGTRGGPDFKSAAARAADGRLTGGRPPMTTFHSRRDGASSARRVVPAPRTGLLYLNTQKRRLYCLNDTARQFVAEGVPITAADLERHPLLTL